GMDNSPAWDAAFARVDPTPTTSIRRSDTGHVGADMRPSDDFYKRVIALIDLYASLGWEPRALWAKTPFKVADLAINAILHRANRDLLALAERFGAPAERTEIAARLEATAAAINRLWSDAAGLYLPFDLIAQHPIEAPISAGFLPLWAGVANAAPSRVMAATPPPLARGSAPRGEALLARARLVHDEPDDRRGFPRGRRRRCRDAHQGRYRGAGLTRGLPRVFRSADRRRPRRRSFLLDRVGGALLAAARGRLELQREPVGQQHLIFAGIARVDAGIGDVREGEAKARAAVELVGDIGADAELEGATEILIRAAAVGSHRAERRQHQATPGDVRVDTRVAEDGSARRDEHARGRTEVEELLAVAE